MCFSHVGHEKSDELVDAAGGLEDASVVGQLLQHLEALKYRATRQTVLEKDSKLKGKSLSSR